MLEVIRFNNEEGPMAMEVYEIEAEIRNLKIMLDDKMILNEDQMNKKLEENEQAYIDKINRAKIRLQLFGEGNDNVNDDWLKPWCLDTWKKFVKDRKKMAGRLHTMNAYVGTDDICRLEHAIHRWRGTIKRQMAYYNSLTQ